MSRFMVLLYVVRGAGGNRRPCSTGACGSSPPHLIYKANALCRNAQLVEQIDLEGGFVVLQIDRLSHAQQPGIALGLIDVERAMHAGNADRPVVLAEKPRAAQ